MYTIHSWCARLSHEVALALIRGVTSSGCNGPLEPHSRADRQGWIWALHETDSLSPLLAFPLFPVGTKLFALTSMFTSMHTGVSPHLTVRSSTRLFRKRYGTLEYFRREKNIVDFDTDGAELQRVDEEQLAMRVERLVTSNNFAKQAHVFLSDPPSKVHFACSPTWINFACVLVCHLKQNLVFFGLCSSLLFCFEVEHRDSRGFAVRTLARNRVSLSSKEVREGTNQSTHRIDVQYDPPAQDRP